MSNTTNQAAKIIVHIGLQKTATRFMQKSVFAPTAAQGVLFNPIEIMPAIHSLFRDTGNVALKVAAEGAIQRYLDANPGATVLISKPDIPGDMYDGYSAYRENLSLLQSLFPSAHIIYFARHPADWLHSAYRQSLVKGYGGPIERFLNFEAGEFRPKSHAYVDGMRNVSALNVPIFQIYEQCITLFGRQHVALICYEDMKASKTAVFDLLRRVIGVERLDIAEPEKLKNRSFSALAIMRFCGGGERKAAPRYSDSPPPYFVQKYIQKPLRKIRAAFIKHGFDDVIYRDWDMLLRNELRRKLTEFYDPQYRLMRVASQKQLVSQKVEDLPKAFWQT